MNTEQSFDDVGSAHSEVFRT